MAQVLAMSATLYNAALQERRDAWKCAGKSVSYFDQCRSLVAVRSDSPEWTALDAQLGRGVLRRVDRAFTDFFRRVKRGQKPGYPRFRSRRRYTCLEVAEPRSGMVRQVGNKAYVKVKGLPVIQLRTNRTLPPSENLTALRIIVRPNGLIVDLVYAVEREPLPTNPVAVGLDLGVNNRVALSTGEMVEPRRVDRRGNRRLRRAVSRSLKGSTTRRKRVRKLSRETRRNTVANRNVVHQMTTSLVLQFGRIAMERLLIVNMTRSARGNGRGAGPERGAEDRLEPGDTGADLGTDTRATSLQGRMGR